jgi:hypothetical protein
VSAWRGSVRERDRPAKRGDRNCSFQRHDPAVRTSFAHARTRPPNMMGLGGSIVGISTRRQNEDHGGGSMALRAKRFKRRCSRIAPHLENIGDETIGWFAPYPHAPAYMPGAKYPAYMPGAKYEDMAMHRVVWFRREDGYESTPVADRTMATAHSTPPFTQMMRAEPGQFSVGINNIVSLLKQRYELRQFRCAFKFRARRCDDVPRCF